jgi:hypothetical protein
MNRTVSGFCFAAALGLTTALGAQTTTTTPAQPGSTSADKANHDVTITGCLSKSANGGYMLTNARMDTGSSSTTTAGSSSTTTASTTTAGGAGSTTTAGATGTTGESSANMPGTTWMLSGGSDLEKHLGHKIQVTGKTEWTGAMEHGRSSTTSASGVGTTATTGTTAAGSSDQPRLDVKSIKMVSASCP